MISACMAVSVRELRTAVREWACCFFSPNFEVEKKYQKIMYQNAHLNDKLNFYAFIL